MAMANFWDRPMTDTKAKMAGDKENILFGNCERLNIETYEGCGNTCDITFDISLCCGRRSAQQHYSETMSIMVRGFPGSVDRKMHVGSVLRMRGMW